MGDQSLRLASARFSARYCIEDQELLQPERRRR